MQAGPSRVSMFLGGCAGLRDVQGQAAPRLYSGAGDAGAGVCWGGVLCRRSGAVHRSCGFTLPFLTSVLPLLSARSIVPLFFLLLSSAGLLAAPDASPCRAWRFGLPPLQAPHTGLPQGADPGGPHVLPSRLRVGMDSPWPS